MSFTTKFEGDVVQIDRFGRAVVAKRVAIVTAVTVLVQLAVNYGWFSIDISNEVLHYLNTILDAVAGVVAIGVIHPVVTPTKDPRNDAGTALVPASQVEALIANALTQAKGGHITEAIDQVEQASTEAESDVQKVTDTVEQDVAPVAAVAQTAVSEAETPKQEETFGDTGGNVSSSANSTPTVDTSNDETVKESDPTLVLPPSSATQS